MRLFGHRLGCLPGQHEELDVAAIAALAGVAADAASVANCTVVAEQGNLEILAVPLKDRLEGVAWLDPWRL